MDTQSSRQTVTRYALLAFMLLCTGLSGQSRFECRDVVIVPASGLGDKLTEIIYENAKAYFKSLNDTYFQANPAQPLKVYLSFSADEARKLIEDHGHLAEANDGFYVPSARAAYAYVTTDDDAAVTLEPVFASIAEHLVCETFPQAPAWFRLGLISFLSKKAQVIDGKVIPGGPCPRAGLALRAEVQAETRLNIKKLYVSSDEGYQQWETGPHLASALFCWLYQNGHLANYVRLVRQKGYQLEVLEEATGASAGKINIDLKKFIEADCCAAAYLAEAEDAQDPNAKEKALQTALEAKPDYPEAQLALARLYWQAGKSDLCQKTLMPILTRPESPHFTLAARLAAEALYQHSSYAQAREYYLKAWEKAGNFPYKYQVAYKIANCSHNLNEPQIAAQWYEKFLELNFQPDQEQEAVAYARKYVETFGTGNPAN